VALAGSSGICPETKTSDPDRIACEYGPIAVGAAAVETASLMVFWGLVAYAALTTLPDRRQRVQTRNRWMPPFTRARTR